MSRSEIGLIEAKPGLTEAIVHHPDETMAERRARLLAQHNQRVEAPQQEEQQEQRRRVAWPVGRAAVASAS